MSKLKLIIFGIIALLFIGLGLTLIVQQNQIKDLNNKLLVAVNNNKAYEQEYSELNDKAIQFEYKIEQLNYSNDSLLHKLLETKTLLKIKDKTITELQYLISENSKQDSIIVRDTIFRDGVRLDTLITDEWSKLSIHAEYPNKIDVNYGFINETAVIFHEEKVTIDPPKKCWLARLFQKKHTIVEVDVLQQNPYCENKEKKFIKIIK